MRDLLAELGLPSWVKTSGSKGFHIVVPLDAKLDFDEVVASFAEDWRACCRGASPRLFTQEFIKADRGDRILVDTGRNTGRHVCRGIRVRAKPGAPVSAPCTWEEIENGKVEPQTFTLRSMAKRLDAAGDLWGDLLDKRLELAGAVDKLAGMAAERPVNGWSGAEARAIARTSTPQLLAARVRPVLVLEHDTRSHRCPRPRPA